MKTINQPRTFPSQAKKKPSLKMPVLLAMGMLAHLAGALHAATIPGLFNTGKGLFGAPLIDDQLDTHYSLSPWGIGCFGCPFSTVAATGSGGFPIPPWLGDSPDSTWITPTPDTIDTGNSTGQGSHLYEIEFDLTGLAPATATITGRWAADNDGVDIFINGLPTGHRTRNNFADWTPFQITQGYVPGKNRLGFLVNNDFSGVPNPTGLRVEMNGTAAIATPISGLFNTGVDDAGTPLADNARESHYTYTLEITALLLGHPYVATEAGGFPIGPWLADNSVSAWITPSTDTSGQNEPAGGPAYSYETSFDLSGMNRATAEIHGQWATDNAGLDILINGRSTGQANTAQFASWTPFRITSGFVQGRNTLTFVLNNGAAENSFSGPSGLRVEMAGTVVADCFTVTTIADSGPGSLRAAIECANRHPGLDTVAFDIPGAGPHTIRPLSPLPVITDQVVIDGLTQPGASPNGILYPGDDARLMVEIDGSSSLTMMNGLVVNAGNSILRGLVINHFDNGGGGIVLSSPSNVVEGCFIGTDPSGVAARPNTHGIWLRDAAFNQIGGTDPNSRNLISGNRYAGIYVLGSASIGNRIQGNYIGADATGLRGLGNGTPLGNGAGIFTQGAFNLIGGTDPGAGNVISGNYQSNLGVTGDTNTIQGNLIGPDATGMNALENGYYGVIVQGGSGNVIGGTASAAGNTISGNRRGIDVASPGTVIMGNRIGTDPSGTQPLGNAIHGILCYSPFPGSTFISTGSIIGGTNPGAGNLIAFNGTDGIKVAGAGTPPFTDGIRISGNSIHDNGGHNGADGLGIDLSPSQSSDGVRGDGPTPNDRLDEDSGPNGLQNFPILTAAELAGGNVVIHGTLDGKPNGTYRLEFFANTAADPSGYGEGELFLGSANITTDRFGQAAILASLPAVAGKPFLAATAADSAGNTSEFSPAISLTSAAAIPCLWNTGVDSSGNPLPDDAAERHYLLVPGGRIEGTPWVARASGGPPIPPWMYDDNTSAWIAPTRDAFAESAFDGSAVYRYETAFDLTGFDPSSVVISGRWSTDNFGRDILVNGTSSGQTNSAQYAAWTPFHLRNGFVAGLNRLTFLVSNGDGEVGVTRAPTGLRVEMVGTGTLTPRLFIGQRGRQIALQWQGPGFMLQVADAVAGPWTDVSSGTSVNGIAFEAVVQPTSPLKFFRLRLDLACAAAQARLRANSTLPVIEDRTAGMVRFLSFKVLSDPASGPTDRALAFLSDYSELFGFTNPADQFRANRIVNDALGAHIFFSQRQGRIDVLGGEIAVHVADAAIVGVNGTYLQRIPDGMVPAIDSQGAVAAAKAGGDSDAAAGIVGTPSLTFFNASLLMSAAELAVRGLDAETHLAWQVTAIQRDGRNGRHLVDARTGQLLLRIPLDKDQAATRDFLIRSALSTSKHTNDCGFDRLVDWFDEAGTIAGATPIPDGEGHTAILFVEQTHDFFFNAFQRRSWDGNDIQVNAVLDVANWSGNAAFVPSCNYFVFGDGMVTSDIVAHEFTHGVTQTSANLVYLNQSGALNESYSDVMAAMVDSANWTIGEGSLFGTFRDMENPARFTVCNPNPPGDCVAHPDHMDDFRTITWDAGGVHINSGIPNRAAVLIAAGGTHRGLTIRGLGRSKAARLYYDVLTTRLTQNSSFQDAANATVQQAKDYVANGLNSFGHDDVCDVQRAFAAVGLPTPDAGDLTPAQFVQIRAVYQRVSDGLEVGSEIIPATGFSRANMAHDRRIILAVTAADNETGVESITLGGEANWECLNNPVQGDAFHPQSDEVRNGTAAPGHPLIRTAHFTINPVWSVCSDPLAVVSITIQVKNASTCETRSGTIRFSYGF